MGITEEYWLAGASFETDTMNSYCSDTVSGHFYPHTLKTTFLSRNNFQPLYIFLIVIGIPNVLDPGEEENGIKIFQILSKRIPQLLSFAKSGH